MWGGMVTSIPEPSSNKSDELCTGALNAAGQDGAENGALAKHHSLVENLGQQ